MMITLPAELQAALERALAGVPATRWMRTAQQLSDRYRAPRSDYERPIATGAADVLGYAALLLPATYAQLWGAMRAAAARIPGWRPATMLDMGSGPGTAIWAAAEHWLSLSSAVAQEYEQAFINLGRDLARSATAPLLGNIRWEAADVRAVPDGRPRRFDLVTIGHVLNEIEPEERAAVIAAAWRMTDGMLLIVEPGTPEGFALVRALRDQLLGEGAQTIAPCAHDLPCPLAGDWCHFPQRIARPEFQRRARAAASQWEEAKFAYVALARFAPERPIWARTIREPEWNKAFASVKLSTRDGEIVRQRALKRNRDAFRRLKELPWGAALAAPEELEAPGDEE
jgi:ribosomal protein RSM22 (predicted rRNA methylase)